MRVFVVGASGLVGGRCLRSLAAAGHEVGGTCHARPGSGLVPLELADAAAVRRAVREARPEVVLLAAAMTQVDRCEDEPGRARALNVEGPRAVAQTCAEVGARLVYFSTEYVFDGLSGPYGEHATPRPLCVYGRTKLEGEEAVREALPGAHLIARTTVVYGWDPEGMNFAMQLLRRLGEGLPMQVPSDQVSTPTYADDLGEVVRSLIERGSTGTYHTVGPDRLDRASFARRLARGLALDPDLVRPVATAVLAQRARRPLAAGLITERLGAELGPGVMDRLRGVDEAAAHMGPLACTA
ncbi:MAG: SDR family oxidoreductase [Planctomycetes bacterium]|nr:SDR family oxidoreductase [Planctomycetota bacterium]